MKSCSVAVVCLVVGAVSGCSAADVEPTDAKLESFKLSAEDINGLACETIDDCPIFTGSCKLCPDGKSESCPDQGCRSNQCFVEYSACPEVEVVRCGGKKKVACPSGYTCEDDATDTCDRSRNSKCAGICVEACNPNLVCTQVITCFNGNEYPTGCGPRNCDKPIGKCDSAAQ